MPSQMHKVTKKLNKKKKDISSLHAGSRDARRLRRAAGRDEKVIKNALLRSKVNEPYIERVRYFQNAIVSSPPPTSLNEKEVQALVEEYISVHKPELKDLEESRRPGRPRSAREDWLRSRIESEQKELGVGYWIPDMVDADNVEKLRNWDGEWGMLSPIKFVRVDAQGSMKESRWPPNGMS